MVDVGLHAPGCVGGRSAAVEASDVGRSLGVCFGGAAGGALVRPVGRPCGRAWLRAGARLPQRGRRPGRRRRRGGGRPRSWSLRRAARAQLGHRVVQGGHLDEHQLQLQARVGSLADGAQGFAEQVDEADGSRASRRGVGLAAEPVELLLGGGDAGGCLGRCA